MRESDNQMVRLVSTKEGERVSGQPSFEGRYVTLSHRWGGSKFTKLDPGKRRSFQRGIEVESLPKTFQHAITVAAELGVRWIWIDAMCILQGHEEDWLHESSQMDKVYAYSYCNISATAARDSSEGLFRDRSVDKVWFDRVSLKTQDLLRDAPRTIECTISDLTFWPESVDNGPVNRRSWVLQERLLAPRVIHFCADQVAFECRTLDRAECRPEGLPNLQMRAGQLLDQARLKAMDRQVGTDLRRLRLASQQGISNPVALQQMVQQIEPKFHIYELWTRIVETYTKMQITEHKDRLIALSGIARMTAEVLKMDGSPDEYLAGMWKNHLESQLLWYVNDKDGVAIQPREDMRPDTYRAPSFSWASVETPRGVVFPETTDQKILIEVLVVRLLYKTEADMYGLLTDGYLVLKGVLRKIELTDALEERRAPGASTPLKGNRYSWQLKANGETVGTPQSIVHLDSPGSGERSIFGPSAQVYCLPVSEDHEYLNCLLLQATDGDHGIRYKRVGLTKILTLFEQDVELVKRLTEPPGRKKTHLGRYYRRANENFWGESHICII
jgi:hypothetical protein